MSEPHFHVMGGQPLEGRFRVQGAKNAVLKEMAATILASGEHHLTNVPRIVDVEIMCELLESMNIKTEFITEDHLVISTPPPGEITPFASYELVERIRASITVLGPLLGRLRSARISMPGGDDFGNRPIDIHLSALESLGASFASAHGYIDGRVENLVGNEIDLAYPSHTATDNILMAAVLADGETVINNAAREPEVIDLGKMLIAMGAKIEGLGTSTITICGVRELHPSTHRVISDRLDAATAIAAVAMAKGEITIEGVRTKEMVTVLRKFKEMGVSIAESNPGEIVVSSEGRLRATQISSLPYPGVATDYLPLLVACLSTADGGSIVTENLYAGRFKYVDELRRLGAHMITQGHHIAVEGVNTLLGAKVKAPDIRAGAALLVAALAAEGTSEIFGPLHLQRGYEKIEERFGALGASVKLVSNET